MEFVILARAPGYIRVLEQLDYCYSFTGFRSSAAVWGGPGHVRDPSQQRQTGRVEGEGGWVVCVGGVWVWVCGEIIQTEGCTASSTRGLAAALSRLTGPGWLLPARGLASKFEM